MIKLPAILAVILLAACNNGNSTANPDSSNMITDSSALMNRDTAGVIGVNGWRSNATDAGRPRMSYNNKK